MATDKQLTANRANAKQSTGPRTAAGKQISRRNALKHGLTGDAIVIGDEDPATFEELRAGFEEDFQPKTAVEGFLVERLAADAFRLMRISVFEAAYINFWYEEARASEHNPLLGDPLRFRPKDNDDGASGKPTVWKIARWLSNSDQFHSALAKLSRYETALLNSFNRHLQQLKVLMEMRQTQLSDDSLLS